MKHLFRRGTALLLSLAMALSLLCVSSFAAALAYAHLEIGAVTVDKLEAGDTVEIPLSVTGMGTGETCGTVGVDITLGAGLAWPESGAVKGTSGMWDNADVNTSSGHVSLLTYGSLGSGTGLAADGEACKLVLKVTEAYSAGNATITLSKVKLTKDGRCCLNSSDKSLENRDTDAVLFNGTKVGNTAVSPITVSGGTGGGTGGGTDPVDPPVDPPLDPTPATYSIVAAATPTSVVAGEGVTVTVTVKGGAYVAAAVQLTWDTDRLTLKTAPTSGWDANTEGTKYSYYNVYDPKQSGTGFAEDTVIGTFVFTAKTLTEAATANINLDKSFVEGSFTDDGTSTTPSTPVANTDASVDITMGELSGWTINWGSGGVYKAANYTAATVSKADDATDATIEWTLDGTSTGSTVPTMKDAGTYAVSYTISKDGYTPVSDSKNITITKKAVTLKGADKSKAYGEDNPHLQAQILPNQYAVYSSDMGLLDGLTISTAATRTSPVGTYDIVIAESSLPAAFTKNYDVTLQKGTLTINKADMTGWTITSKGTAQYTGSEQVSATVTKGTPTDATVTYSWNDGANTSTDEVPSFTAAGTYTVSYTISYDNYNDVTGSYTFTITPATLTGVVVPEMDTITYDGREHGFDPVTCTTEGVSITYSETEDGTYSTTIPTNKNAGTHTLYYKVTKDGYTPKTGSYEMYIAPRKITITPDNKEKTYGETDPVLTFTATNVVEGESIKVTLKREGTEDVGSYDITAEFKSVDNPNYNAVTINKGTFTIKKATMSGWKIESNGTKQYTGSAQASATVTPGTPTDATVTYTWGTDGTSTTVPSFTDEGTYKVNYTISHKNYNDVTGSYTFKIEQGDITASGANVNVTYDGNPHSITVTVTQPEGTTIYYRTSESEEWSTTNPTFTDVTDGAQTVYWKVSKTGYTDATGSNTVTITKASMTGVTVTAADAVTYDGEAHAAVKTATTPTGASIQYSSDNGNTWVSTIPSFTNASTYTVKYRVTKANYNDVTDSVTFKIEKCEVTIVPNDKHVYLGDALPTLDGTVQGLVNDDDLGTITYSCPTFDTTKTGDYPITATYTENANYAVTVADSAKVNVSNPDFVAEYVSEYVSGYHMILVYTDSKATFSFDSKAMYDVSGAGYKYNDTAYTHVYAIVVKGAEGDTEDTVLEKVKADMTAVAATLDYTKKLDVNSSDSVDLRDAVAVVAVYNVNETYMTSYMKIVLKSDVDNSKNVDASDFNLIKAEYLK